MNEASFFRILLWSWFGLSAFVFFLLFFLSAPYGRHRRKGWGPSIPSTLGWMLMEAPAVIVPILCFSLSTRKTNPLLGIFLAMWLLHYLHRTFVYPLRMRMRGKKMFVIIAALAFFTNICVDYLSFRWLATLGPVYPTSWLYDPRFIIGALCFFAGFAINLHSDEILRNLRKPGETDYKVPHGGVYRWVSCPNYTGEILEWTGWAIATWSLPTLAFTVWTISNLLPRALEHHRWYRQQFSDYPPERKALIPYLL